MRFQVFAEDAGRRLDQFLKAKMPRISRREILAWIDDGRVRCDGRAARKGERLSEGAWVDVDMARLETGGGGVLPQDSGRVRVLFEDASLVAVAKPPGMATYPLHLEEIGAVVNDLVVRYPEMQGIGFSPLEPGIVHRLDRDTSGILIAARTARAFERLREEFRRKRVVKSYLAMVHGDPGPGGTIDLPIGSRGRHTPKVIVVSGPMPGRPLRTVSPARTSYRVVRRLPPFNLVRLVMQTGARHQLRAHMAHLAHPIVGDALYGPVGDVVAGRLPIPPRQMLHASEVRFLHPLYGTRMRIRCPLPEDFIEFIAASGTGP